MVLAVKDYILKNYKVVRDCYKVASSEAAGRMPFIGSTTFNLIFTELPGFVDGETIKNSDVDLAFVAANSMKGDW